MRSVKVTLEEGAIAPFQSTDGSAGWDLCALRDTTVYSQSFESVRTGIRLDAGDYCGIISHRSGHNARSGIKIYGLIDPDYRGELIVSIHNDGRETWRIKKGEKIAQIRFVEVPKIKIEVVEKLDDTGRGSGGFGSTGSSGYDDRLRDAWDRR